METIEIVFCVLTLVAGVFIIYDAEQDRKGR